MELKISGHNFVQDLKQVKELIEEGKVRSVIDRRHPLEHPFEAHRYVETGQKRQRGPDSELSIAPCCRLHGQFSIMFFNRTSGGGYEHGINQSFG